MKIAVVCAVNADGNTGMATVDRAARAFFSDRKCSVDWFVAGTAEAHCPGTGEVEGYASVFDAPDFPEAYDRIVFWGDFLQCRTHHTNLAPALVRSGRAENEEAALILLRRFLLLEGSADEIIKRAAIVGASIHPDGAEIFSDGPYLKAVSRFLSLACSVRMRDPLSSYRASILGRRDGTVGLDAAFLAARNSVWNEAAADRRSRGPLRIAVVGGRSDRRRGRKLKITALSARQAFRRSGVNTDLEVLPWLNRDLGSWAGFSVERPSDWSPTYCLDRLCASDALVTDVYHAAINAWARGIPVVLLGTGAELDVTTIQSKKKEMLSLSMFLGRNYIFDEHVSPVHVFDIGARVRSLLISEEDNRAAFEQRRRDAKWLWAKLEEEIGLPPLVSGSRGFAD